MSNWVKIILFVVLVAGTCVFGFFFLRNYGQLMQERIDLGAADPTVERQIDHQPASRATHRFSEVVIFGGLFFASVVGLGILVAHEASHLIANRFGRILYGGEGESIRKSQYEEAEELWANGQPLEAVQLLREYLKEHPREQHVALRIAEIYEKDLRNPLAAALEFEEVLRKKLAPEQWGWAAIHLCNLYTQHLGQPDRATALLQRIVAEYGHTSAAAKARKRLGIEEESPSPAPSPDDQEDSFFGKARKANLQRSDDLQARFDRFHQSNPRGPAPD